jgi:hypothetical protein
MPQPPHRTSSPRAVFPMAIVPVPAMSTTPGAPPKAPSMAISASLVTRSCSMTSPRSRAIQRRTCPTRCRSSGNHTPAMPATTASNPGSSPLSLSSARRLTIRSHASPMPTAPMRTVPPSTWTRRLPQTSTARVREPPPSIPTKAGKRRAFMVLRWAIPLLEASSHSASTAPAR